MMKNKIFSILAWGLFTAITLISFSSLYYGVAEKGYSHQDPVEMAGDLFFGLLPVVFAFLACLIISRQPGNSIGWLLILPALALAGNGISGYTFSKYNSAPADPSLFFTLGFWFYSWNWLLLIFPIFLIILLYPTGKPASRRWSWATIFVSGVFISSFILIAFSSNIQPNDLNWKMENPLGFIPDSLADSMFIYAFSLLSTTILSVLSVIFRYRCALPIEREQIKWLLYACIVFAVIYIAAILQNIGTENWGASGVVTVLLPLALMGIPVAITVAILRYRLWDIEVIIRKTLVYGLLTGALALLYFGLVTLLQFLSASVFGLYLGLSEASPVVIVLSTLAIAGLFNPLRIRIQDVIDRRFYRKKYDAEKALARFAEAARNETDIKCLNEALLEVVQETVQPESVSLWLKPIGRKQ